MKEFKYNIGDYVATNGKGRECSRAEGNDKGIASVFQPGLQNTKIENRKRNNLYNWYKLPDYNWVNEEGLDLVKSVEIPSSNHPELIKGRYYSYYNIANEETWYFKFDSIQGTYVYRDGYRSTGKWDDLCGVGNHTDISNMKDIKEISESEAKGIIDSNKSMGTNKFEVGKWYKDKQNKFYAKCLKFEDDRMYSDYHILTGSYYNIPKYSFSKGYKWELLTDLSEIQQYLPEGHPDKQEPKYEYEVVHCKTQEEWDFVISKLGKLNLDFNKSTDSGGKIDCLNIKSKSGGSKGWYTNQKNAKIYSFEEWCKQFNHIYKPKEEDLIGRYVKTTRDFGYENILKGDLYLITSENKGTRLKDNVKECSVFLNTNDFELMPIGFNPESNNYPLTTKECYNSGVDPYQTIEVGDEVELLRTPHAGYDIGDRCIIQKVKNSNDFEVFRKGTTELMGGCNFKGYWKIIKKSNNTIHERQVDGYSPISKIQLNTPNEVKEVVVHKSHRRISLNQPERVRQLLTN